MPAVSEKQRKFMGAELARKRAGQKTQTGMSEQQLSDFASKGESVSHKKETKEGRSIVDVEIHEAKPETSKLGLSKHGVTDNTYGQTHIRGPITEGELNFASDSALRSPQFGMHNGAVVYHGGPDTAFRAEEINPQHYGRDYEPGPYKDLFKTPQKAWEAGIRRVWDDCYQECETPGAVIEGEKSVRAYGTVGFEDVPTENPDYRTFKDQYSFARQHDEIDAELDSEDDEKPGAFDKARAHGIMRRR